jgi:hypothetical protein
MYEKGLGVEQDNAQAAALYRKAAAQGDPDAQFNLAEMYRDGRGVVRDCAESLQFYKMAAARGHEPAQNALKSLTNPCVNQ